MIKEQTEMYHKYNDLVREGDYYRIASFSEMVIMIATWKSRRINLKHL